VSEPESAPAAPSEKASRNLLQRVAAALVLAPLGMAAAYAGGWSWAVLVTLATIGIYVEWLTVVGAAEEPVVSIGGAVLGISGFCLARGELEAAVLVMGAGLATVALLSRGRRAWTVAGFVYAAGAELASILVRLDPVEGWPALLLVLLVVWASDIGGYFAGRGIGGPKLWPQVSPNKTWAGAIGGFVASLAIAGAFAMLNQGRTGPLLLVATVLSVASQLGDLFESAVKRRFGVKDSSHIIPGHGGLMDRLDGLVAAMLLAAVFGFLRGGADGVGRALMVW
jgi:phosphatidate cytidylyltransferase